VPSHGLIETLVQKRIEFKNNVLTLPLSKKEIEANDNYADSMWGILFNSIHDDGKRFLDDYTGTLGGCELISTLKYEPDIRSFMARVQNVESNEHMALRSLFKVKYTVQSPSICDLAGKDEEYLNDAMVNLFMVYLQFKSRRPASRSSIR
jgi:hypothetical protein